MRIPVPPIMRLDIGPGMLRAWWNYWPSAGKPWVKTDEEWNGVIVNFNEWRFEQLKATYLERPLW